MSEMIDKEVYFNEYCSKCEHEKKAENESPCDDCLEYPSNTYSHKPVRFEPKEDKDGN